MEERERRARRDSIIDVLHASAGSQTVGNFVELCSILRDEIRTANDTAELDAFMLNKGEIRAYTRLIKFIRRGKPAGNVNEGATQ